MKKAIVIIILILTGFANLRAQNMTREEAENKASLNSPAQEHNALKQFEGEWRRLYYFTPYMQEPLQGKGEATTEIIYGGRFVEINAQVEVIGQLFHSKMFIGFDRRYEKYFYVMFDDYQTYEVRGEGDYDPKKREFEFYGSYFDALQKEEVEFKLTLTFERNDKYYYRLYEKLQSGRYHKAVEIGCIKKPD